MSMKPECFPWDVKPSTCFAEYYEPHHSGGTILALVSLTWWSNWVNHDSSLLRQYFGIVGDSSQNHPTFEIRELQLHFKRRFTPVPLWNCNTPRSFQRFDLAQHGCALQEWWVCILDMCPVYSETFVPYTFNLYHCGASCGAAFGLLVLFWTMLASITQKKHMTPLWLTWSTNSCQTRFAFLVWCLLANYYEPSPRKWWLVYERLWIFHASKHIHQWP